MTDSIYEFDRLEALTVAQVCKLLNVSRPTVMKYIKNGELMSTTIGRCRRVRRMDLEGFLEHHRQYGWQSYQPGVQQDDGFLGDFF